MQPFLLLAQLGLEFLLVLALPFLLLTQPGLAVLLVLTQPFLLLTQPGLAVLLVLAQLLPQKGPLIAYCPALQCCSALLFAANEQTAKLFALPTKRTGLDW
jgi:hypothetical protein